MVSSKQHILGKVEKHAQNANWHEARRQTRLRLESCGTRSTEGIGSKEKERGLEKEAGHADIVPEVLIGSMAVSLNSVVLKEGFGCLRTQQA